MSTDHNFISITLADFKENQQGRLGDDQRILLRKKRMHSLIAGLGFVALLILVFLAIREKIENPDFGERGPFWLGIAIGLFWLWLLRNSWIQWRAIGIDLREGAVKGVTGRVRQELKLNPGIISSLKASVICEEFRFPVSQDTLSRFQGAQAYTIYYAPLSRVFLGATSAYSPGKNAAQEEIMVPSPPIDAEPLLLREQEILELMAQGMSNQQIADKLYLSINTIKMYTSQIYKKLDVRRRTEAVARARETGLL